MDEVYLASKITELMKNVAYGVYTVNGRLHLAPYEITEEYNIGYGVDTITLTLDIAFLVPDLLEVIDDIQRKERRK